MQLDAGTQETLPLLPGEDGEVGDRGIGARIADPHVGHVQMGQRRIHDARLLVSVGAH